ncbi:MAG: TolC family protein [Burkholderiaceae bacterium]|nr:TolC family protein [Burkholderiaceae bacterium]
MKTLNSAKPLALALVVAAVFGGCASTTNSDGNLAQLIEQRTGTRPPVATDTAARTTLKKDMASLAAQALTADTAVHIALLNNPSILARYDEAGIAAADLEQAGRLPNPEFSFKRTHGEGQIFIERGLTINLLDLLTLPLALRMERRRYEATRLDIAQAAVSLTAQVRSAYVEAVAARQAAHYMEDAAAAAEASRELAQHMAEAGNWSRLDAARQEAFDAATSNDAARAANLAQVAAQRLARLLGTDDGAALILPDTLPPLPERVSEAPVSIDAAVKARLDVQAAQQRTEWQAQDLGLTRATRFIDVLNLGAVENRNEGAPRAPGYEINIGIPLFDWGEAKSRRAEALYLQSADRLAATVQDAASEIRIAQANRLQAYELARRYRDDIMPRRKRIADETLLRYNGMLIGVFELLNDARAQIADTRAAIDALKDYWIAEAALQSACGGIVTNKEVP